MPEPDDVHGPQVDYAIDPQNLEQGIKWYLTPVIKRLDENNQSYSEAHMDIATAHDNEAPGWFVAIGNDLDNLGR